MKKPSKKLTNLICIVLVVTVMIFLFHEVFTANYKKYDTQTATEITEQEILEMKAFVVRDEKYIDGNLSGTVVPLVNDGNRVASGDSVAVVCNSDKDADNYASLCKSKEEFERYQYLSEQTELNSLDMKKLNNEINNCFTNILSISSSGKYTELSENIEELENKLASKQILTEGSIDLSEKFDTINSNIQSLESKNISTTSVTAPVSGYYISNIDGYENSVKYDDIKNLNVSEIEKIMSSKPAEIEGKIGKIVGSYKWYMVSVVDSKYSTSLKKGKQLSVNLPFYGYFNVPVVVESVSAKSDNKIAVVFSCNMMNETYANMRMVDAKLVLAEYTGYKINPSSVRCIKDDKGNPINVVFIIRGNIMNARRVEILYDAGDYLVVSKNTEEMSGYKPVRLYDEVILRGRNLKNGKSVI